MAHRSRGTLAALASLLAALLVACSGGADGAATALPSPAAAAATAVAPLAPAPSASPTAASTGSTSAVEFADPEADRAFEHIRVLAVDIGSRTATGEQEREAAAYIAEQLEAYGYTVTVELFPVQLTQDASSVEVLGTRLTTALGMAGSPQRTAEGPLVEGGLGRATELSALDVEGAVLLLDRGVLTFADKALNAQAAGAIAVVVANNQPGPFGGSLGDALVRIPVVAVSREDGARLRELSAEGATVTVRSELREIAGQSQNVVGRPTPQCEAYLGAHYDSVEAGPGANDNASGTAAMLELARTHVVDGLCVIAFGAEEIGLWGSRAFVRRYDVGGARFMLNLDMMAKTTKPELIASEGARSRALADRASAIAAAEGFDVPRGAFPAFASSDHASFADGGVPSITVHSGDDPLIHQPGDDITNVSRDDLALMLEIAAAVLRGLLAEELLR